MWEIVKYSRRERSNLQTIFFFSSFAMIITLRSQSHFAISWNCSLSNELFLLLLSFSCEFREKGVAAEDGNLNFSRLKVDHFFLSIVFFCYISSWRGQNDWWDGKACLSFVVSVLSRNITGLYQDFLTRDSLNKWRENVSLPSKGKAAWGLQR